VRSEQRLSASIRQDFFQFRIQPKQIAFQHGEIAFEFDIRLRAFFNQRRFDRFRLQNRLRRIEPGRERGAGMRVLIAGAVAVGGAGFGLYKACAC
jgi:hypothetical protein